MTYTIHCNGCNDVIGPDSIERSGSFEFSMPEGLGSDWPRMDLKLKVEFMVGDRHASWSEGHLCLKCLKRVIRDGFLGRCEEVVAPS